MTDKLWITWTTGEREEFVKKRIDSARTLGEKKWIANQAESFLLDADYYITKKDRWNGVLDGIKLEAFAGDDITKIMPHLWTLHAITGLPVETTANGVLISLTLA